jgi:hypothetical protein
VGSALQLMEQGYKDKHLDKPFHIGGAGWRKDVTIRFLETLINQLSDNGGHIQFRTGFVMGDLLIQMMRQRPNGADLVGKLVSMLVAENAGDETRLSIFPETFSDGLDRNAPVVDLTRTCALFDLGQIKMVEKAITVSRSTEDYYLITVRHDLDVPVGVGFSLPLLPALLRKGHWDGTGEEYFLYEAVRRQAAKAFVFRKEVEEPIEKFLSIGIDLTELESDPHFNASDSNVTAFPTLKLRS